MGEGGGGCPMVLEKYILDRIIKRDIELSKKEMSLIKFLAEIFLFI